MNLPVLLIPCLCVPILQAGPPDGPIPPDAPFPPAEAPARMTVPEGFRVTLFAGEPDVVQPIAFTFDDRGRVWVVECLSYPSWHPKEGAGQDRVVIFEDRDGDGRFDERKVFLDRGRNLSGIELGFGGVWLCSTPELVFVPDRDGDDVPDGPPVPVLDGWDLQAKHNVSNGLEWGPDGWLYGLNGILSISRVGKPGATDGERTQINCGVWRYHPVRGTFEAVAHGTTNPWGIDFDDHGRMFITNCVIQHIWHVVPGAHFERMFGQDFNPHLYRLLSSGADHIHWAGGPWQESRSGLGAHGAAGGGHAHSGAMVYLGDNWPDRYRNTVFLCNLHGTRVNNDAIEPRGSTVSFRHAKDFLFANDPWFRGLVVKNGPDGGVYIADWSDTGECHDYDDVHRESGRIYKITFGEPRRERIDLAKLDDAALVELELHRNDWRVRHSRRILEERAAAGKLSKTARTALAGMLRSHPDVTRRLRALWALHATGGLDEGLVLELLDDADAFIQGWTVRLELEDGMARQDIFEKLESLAGTSPAPLVRLDLASALQRLPLEKRWGIAEGLAARAEGAADLYLPLMIWYGIEPLVAADPARAAKLLETSRIPLVRQHLARRLADPEALARLLARSTDPTLQLDVLQGLREALRGRRRAPMPEDWPAARAKVEGAGDPEAVEIALTLSLVFGDLPALASLQNVLEDPSARPNLREKALGALLQTKDAGLPGILHRLLEAPGPLRAHAIRALAAFEEESTPRLLLVHYAAFTDAEKQDALSTLGSRPAYALTLLGAVARGRIPRRDVSAFTARQLASLGNDEVSALLREVWGEVRPAAEAKPALVAKYRALLAPEELKRADRSRGREVFAKTCSTCHKLFGEGGSIGPELTGSQRTNLDYLLENLLDPSAAVARDYQMTVIQTKDGRVLTGIIKEENANAVTVQTANEAVVIPIDEIAVRERSELSMMPEDMLLRLPEEEVRELVGYLGGEG